MIVSTFTCSAATASKTVAAAPGRSGMPVSVNTTSFSLCVTAEMIAFSMPSSPIQVPCSSENVERAWMRTPWLRASSTDRSISTFAPDADISSISS